MTSRRLHAGFFKLSLSQNDFMDGTSANYIEQMYNAWVKDPNSVHTSWSAYFSNIVSGVPPEQAFVKPPSLGGTIPQFSVSPQATDSTLKQLRLSVQVQSMIRAYQVMGHNMANLDPLGLMERKELPALKPETYGISESDMDLHVTQLKSEGITLGFIRSDEPMTVRQVLNELKTAYCDTIGAEFMHIQDRAQCNWLRERLENRQNTYVPTPDDRRNTHNRLAWATYFEEFCDKKFSERRFGCDGGESIIPAIKTFIDHASEHGVEAIVFGMAHRGRLNVLTNIVRKPLAAIFNEFQSGTFHIDDIASGDVKYHLGTSCDRPTRNGKQIHLSLVANPSHLEAVNPVVEGKVYAKQFFKHQSKKEKVVSLLIHGDASFAGQGVVYETITMAGLPKYCTGGTVHVIINNQIGFTTNPEDLRPGQYCTDVAKSAGAPIFHVNGDDPDALCWVMKLAAEWRQTFLKDIVIDIICYRRFGHNETDQPKFTQPVLYAKIEKQPKTLKIYEQLLKSQGILTEEDIQKTQVEVNTTFENELKKAPTYQPNKTDWLCDNWQGIKGPGQLAQIQSTGVPLPLIATVSKALTTVPPGFNLHSVPKKGLEAKEKMFQTGKDIDWATAEALAFGTILLEGFHVRLSGQDVERGTFSHRHAVLHDQLTGAEYVPLNNIEGQKAHLAIQNSFLSEYAALGFELGFSLENPNSLVMWEGQFGDFANGAQIMIDQFISSGEQKWMRQSGLVLLLPHGYEGQGPEHSSARIERFLQMCDQNLDAIPNMDQSQRRQIQLINYQIVNCTTPANYFHVLRRQLHREFRKPLVIFTPKTLLRHELAKSPISAFDDVGDDTRFLRVIHEVDTDIVSPEKCRRIIFCSGKVYYDLYKQRAERNIKDIPIIRVEQLAPFPFDHVSKEIQKHPNAQIMWVQEEPKNMGAWTFAFFNIRTCLRSLNDTRQLKYAGRSYSAAPATGNKKVHDKELKKLLDEAFSL